LNRHSFGMVVLKKNQRVRLLRRIVNTSMLEERQFYEGSYSRWKDVGKEMEFLALQWATRGQMR
jgi:hypothetical protein